MTTGQARKLMALARKIADKRVLCVDLPLWRAGIFAGLQAREVDTSELPLRLVDGDHVCSDHSLYARGWRVGYDHVGDEACPSGSK